LRQEKRRGVFLTCETPIAPWIWMARSMRFCEEKRISALTFPYVCPEPVLVKYSFSLQNGAKDAFPYLCHLRDQRLYDREQLTCARVGIACPVTASHTDDRVLLLASKTLNCQLSGYWHKTRGYFKRSQWLTGTSLSVCVRLYLAKYCIAGRTELVHACCCGCDKHPSLLHFRSALGNVLQDAIHRAAAAAARTA
jgi:hypothetical protein